MHNPLPPGARVGKEIMDLILRSSAGIIRHSEVIRRFLVDGKLTFLGEIVCCLGAFNENGSQVFVVGPRLQDMFMHTSMDGVRWSDLKMPYSSFFVRVPECGLSIPCIDCGKSERVGGMFVSRGKTPTLDVGILTTIVGDETMAADHADADHHPVGMSRLANEESFVEYQGDDLYEDNEGEVTELEIDAVRGTGKSMLRILANLAMYLSSKGRDVVTTPPEESLRRRHANAKARLAHAVTAAQKAVARAALADLPPLYSTTVVGGNIERSYREESSARDYHAVRRHWVRGHWRNQACGAQRLDHRWIWIQPFEKGTGPAAAGREYSVI
jgi:hypothetical protein